MLFFEALSFLSKPVCVYRLFMKIKIDHTQVLYKLLYQVTKLYSILIYNILHACNIILLLLVLVLESLLRNCTSN